MPSVWSRTRRPSRTNRSRHRFGRMCSWLQRPHLTELPKTRATSLGQHECDGVTQRAPNVADGGAARRTRPAASCREPRRARGRSGRLVIAAGRSEGPGTRRSSPHRAAPGRRGRTGRRRVSKSADEARQLGPSLEGPDGAQEGFFDSRGRGAPRAGDVVVTSAPSDEAHWTRASREEVLLGGEVVVQGGQGNGGGLGHLAHRDPLVVARPPAASGRRRAGVAGGLPAGCSDLLARQCCRWRGLAPSRTTFRRRRRRLTRASC